MIGRLSIALLGIVLLFQTTLSFAQTVETVQVADPFIEMRTGAGRGFPIFYVLERGGHINIIKRRGNWFKVQVVANRIAQQDKIGWVDRRQLERTLGLQGEEIAVADPDFSDAKQRHWQAGIFSGDFDGASLNSFMAGYQFTDNLSMEVSVTQVLGDQSELKLVNLAVFNTLFPDWRVSPYLSLGSGRISIKPKAALVENEDRRDDVIDAAIGLRAYLARRFFLRLEYRHYVVLTNRDDNQELDEWKFGFNIVF